MKVYSILNLKGGVGKTVTAVNLAYVLHHCYDKRVLLIDADSQGNASSYGPPPERWSGTLAEMMCGIENDPYSVITTDVLHGVDLITADFDLNDADILRAKNDPLVLRTIPDLVRTLREDDAYDVVVIDCPPSFSCSCVSAIAASTDVIIPLRIDNFAISGMRELTSQVNGLRAIAPDLRIAGVLVTQQHRSNVQRDGLAYLRAKSPAPVFAQTIRRATAVEESTFARLPVERYAPLSKGSEEYRMWIKEWMKVTGVGEI